MIKAKRVVFNAPREVAIEPVELSKPERGQALLRTSKTLISTGTELTALTGDFPPNSRWADYCRYPFPVGYSSVATVAVVGPGVECVKAGDRVASHAGHATEALYPADRLWPIPDGVDDEAATFATLAEIVLGGVRRSRLMLGESVVILGAGLLGQLAVAFCRVAGAWPLVVLDPAEQRLPFATNMGASHALPLTGEQARDEVVRITRQRMADVVIEVTGNPQAIVGALKLARPLGRVILLGSPRGPVKVDLHDEAHSNSLEIIGTHNMAHPPVETPNAPWTMRRHVELFFDWQAAGIVDVRPLITHRFGWQLTPEAYGMLLADRSQALGVVLDWASG